MKVYVLLRFSKRSGNIDTVMTGITSALMQMWALNNTPTTKVTMIVEQVTGLITFVANGTKDGFPEVKKNVGHCEDFGISFEFIQSIEDDRF